MRFIYPPCPGEVRKTLLEGGPQAFLANIQRYKDAKWSVIGEPHRVYYVDPDTLLKTGLGAATTRTWRIQHRVGNELAASEVREDAPTKVVSVEIGKYSKAPGIQIEQLNNTVGDVPYEVRLLRLPELRFLAVWMHADADDLFIPVALPPPMPSTASLYPLAAISELIAARKSIYEGSEQDG